MILFGENVCRAKTDDTLGITGARSRYLIYRVWIYFIHVSSFILITPPILHNLDGAPGDMQLCHKSEMEPRPQVKYLCTYLFP